MMAQEFYDWAFTHDPYDQKYHSLVHPIFAICTCSFAVFIAVFILEKFNNKENSVLPTYAKKYILPFQICYILFQNGLRIPNLGTLVIYDLIWACNLAQFLFCYGIYINSTLLIGSSLCIVCQNQVVWYYDLVTYFLYGKMGLGVAGYLLWPQTTLVQIITCTHHLWFIPLALYVLKHQKLTIYMWLHHIVLMVIFILSAQFLTPKNINIDGELRYLNINVSYEMFSSVDTVWFKQHDKSGFNTYFWFLLFIWSGVDMLVFFCLGIIQWIFIYQQSSKIKTN